MAAVMRPPPMPRTGSGILMNPSPVMTTKPLAPARSNSTSKKFMHNTSSNNSLSSSASSSGENTDGTMSSQTHQTLSQSWSVSSMPAQKTDTLSVKPAPRSSSIPSGRRIRFAPLPDPRALEAADAEDIDGTMAGGDKMSVDASSDGGCSSLSSSAVFAPGIHLTIPKGAPPCDITMNTSQSTLADPCDPNQMTPTAGGSPTTSLKKGSGWTSKPKKLFKPFLKRSSSPMAPAGNISAEELSSLNLFRSSSQQSRTGSISSDEGGNGWGSPLNRWTSGGSHNTSKGKSKEWLGSPLARSQSTGSYKGDVRGRTAKPKSKSTPTTPTQTSQNKKMNGTRMLNGRVYGGRRLNGNTDNLFITAKDTEPEFVEWGYGGMGSNKSTGGSQWSRVQSDSTAAASNDDDDDGSGIGWARRRREKREREKAEAEEKAKQEAAAKENGEVEKSEVDIPGNEEAASEHMLQDEALTSSPVTAQSEQASMLLAADDVTPSAASATQPPKVLSSPPTDEQNGKMSDTEKEEHHITTAVNIPAPAPNSRPHHHRSDSAVSGQSNSLVNPTSEHNQRDRTITPLRSSSFDSHREHGKEAEEKTEDESSSDGEDENENENEREDEDDDDEAEDEEDEAAQQQRATALGAGVEKISRHKDER